MAKRTRKVRVMSDEQKRAAAERLAKAREKRLKNNPPQYVSINEDVRNLPDDDTFSLKNVRAWLKANKEMRQGLKPGRKDPDPKLLFQYNKVDQYVKAMESYLRDGVWTNLFYGEQQQSKTKFRVMRNGMAYNKDGTPKRTIGYWYEDLGEVYTQEMYDQDNTINRSVKGKRKK